jgi:hypothetical protein
MRRKQLGTAAAGALATYLSFGLTRLAASRAGLNAELMGVVYVGLMGAIFYLLMKLFPGTFADGSRGPRPTRWRVVAFLLSLAALLHGRVVVFLLILATTLVGFFQVLGRPWAASPVGYVWAALPVGGLLLLNLMENRGARRGQGIYWG